MVIPLPNITCKAAHGFSAHRTPRMRARVCVAHFAARDIVPRAAAATPSLSLSSAALHPRCCTHGVATWACATLAAGGKLLPFDRWDVSGCRCRDGERGPWRLVEKAGHGNPTPHCLTPARLTHTASSPLPLPLYLSFSFPSKILKTSWGWDSCLSLSRETLTLPGN